jgi:hypothetical protein
MIQGSASGDANIGARKRGAGHSDTSATRAAGTKGIGFTDAELDALVKEGGWTRDQLKHGNAQRSFTTFMYVSAPDKKPGSVC